MVVSPPIVVAEPAMGTFPLPPGGVLAVPATGVVPAMLMGLVPALLLPPHDVEAAHGPPTWLPSLQAAPKTANTTQVAAAPIM